MTTEPPREKPPWEQAVDLGLAIQELIDEDLPPEAIEEGEAFFASVRESVVDVVATIERTRRVTKKQRTALHHWREAVGNWIE